MSADEEEIQQKDELNRAGQQQQLIENRALAGQSERVDETRSRYSNSSISDAKVQRKIDIIFFFRQKT